MVEISTSSCDKISKKDVFSGTCSFLERGARVVNLFTRPRKSSGEYDTISDGNTDSEPVITPEIVSLLAQNSLPHFTDSLDVDGTLSRTNVLISRGEDSEVALSRHDSDSSRELLFKTPAEYKSSCTVSNTSPEIRLQEFEEEFAKLRAERFRQRAALREQVLSEIDIPSKCDDLSSPSTSIVVSRNAGSLSENDDRSSLSSRSSEENLTFQDATDDFNDDDDGCKPESEEKKGTGTSKSVDFSFLHSVYRTKGKHEEAILLSMKYAGNTEVRKDRDDRSGTTNTASSNSISSVTPRPETKLFKEYANIIRETMIRTCETGANKYRFQEKTTVPDVHSIDASGSTTPSQRCDLSANQSAIMASSTSSKTSVEVYTESLPQVESPPQSRSSSEQSSQSPSRSSSPTPTVSKTQLKSEAPSRSFNGYPDLEETAVTSQQDGFQGSQGKSVTPSQSFNRYPDLEASAATSQREGSRESQRKSETPLQSFNGYPDLEASAATSQQEGSRESQRKSETPSQSFNGYPDLEASAAISQQYGFRGSQGQSETPSQSFHGYPDSEESASLSQEGGSREYFNRGQEFDGQLSSHCSTNERSTFRHDTHNLDFHGYDPESTYKRQFHFSDPEADDVWPPSGLGDLSARSGQRKPHVVIPITLDGRIVYPEVIFAQGSQSSRGPLGLLDRVKSFAKSCGPYDKNKRQDQISTSTYTEGSSEGEKTSAKLNGALLSRLICVECGILCTPPVAICMWGHIVCEECRPVGLWEYQRGCWCRKRCPQCAGDMMSRPCELWTNIARSLLYPCRFTSYGCREVLGMTPTEKYLHEESCHWRQLRCWCHGCSWRGLWHQMRAHVTNIHLPHATRADWYRFVTVSGFTPTGRSSDVITLPANELVLLHSMAVIGEHRYLLQYLNDDGGSGAVLFLPRFKLRVISTDGKSEVEIRGEAVPGQHDVERALRSGRCFRLSGTPFGLEPVDDRAVNDNVTVQLCLEKGRLSRL